MADQVTAVEDITAAGLVGKPTPRERWWSLMDTDIGIIPLPVYVVLLGREVGRLGQATDTQNPNDSTATKCGLSIG